MSLRIASKENIATPSREAGVGTTVEVVVGGEIGTVESGMITRN